MYLSQIYKRGYPSCSGKNMDPRKEVADEIFRRSQGIGAIDVIVQLGEERYSKRKEEIIQNVIEDMNTFHRESALEVSDRSQYLFSIDEILSYDDLSLVKWALPTEYRSMEDTMISLVKSIPEMPWNADPVNDTMIKISKNKAQYYLRDGKTITLDTDIDAAAIIRGMMVKLRMITECEDGEAIHDIRREILKQLKLR